VSWLLLGGIGLSIVTSLILFLLSFCSLGCTVCGSVGDRTLLFGGFVPMAKVTVEIFTLGSAVSWVVSLGCSTLGSGMCNHVGIISAVVGCGLFVSISSRRFSDLISSSPSRFVFLLAFVLSH
jgi:hypothetical protein